MFTSPCTPEQATRALQIVAAVGEAIQSLGSVASGTLYAQLMGRLTLDQYQSVIASLERAKLVHRSPSHLLTWIGPAK